MNATLGLRPVVVVPGRGVPIRRRRRRRVIVVGGGGRRGGRIGGGGRRGRGPIRVRGALDGSGSGSESGSDSEESDFDSFEEKKAGAKEGSDDSESFSEDRSEDPSEYETDSDEETGSYEEPQPATISAPLPAQNDVAVAPSQEQLHLAEVHNKVLMHPDASTKLLHVPEIDCNMCGKKKSSLPAFDSHECTPPIEVDVCEEERRVQCVHVHRYERDVIEPDCEPECEPEPVCEEESESSSSSESCEDARGKYKKKKKRKQKKSKCGCKDEACNKTWHHKPPVKGKKDCKPKCPEEDIVTTDSYDCWMKEQAPVDYSEPISANLCGSASAACHPFDARTVVRAINAGKPFKASFAHRYVSHKPMALKAKQAGKEVPPQALQYIHVELKGKPAGDNLHYVDMHVMPMTASGDVARNESSPMRVYKIKQLADGSRKVSVIGKNLAALKNEFGERKAAIEEAHAHMTAIFGRNF